MDCIYRILTGNSGLPDVPCSRTAEPGKQYCWQHDPDRKTKHQKRIEELTADLKAARLELLERGGHTPNCPYVYLAADGIDVDEENCTCDWEKRRAELEKQVKGR